MEILGGEGIENGHICLLINPRGGRVVASSPILLFALDSFPLVQPAALPHVLPLYHTSPLAYSIADVKCAR